MTSSWIRPWRTNEENFGDGNASKKRSPHLKLTFVVNGGLRDLSREFLNSEMHQHFITELLLFGILFAASVWPMLSLADALSVALK